MLDILSQHVINHDLNEAAAILSFQPELCLVKTKITDRSKRTFKNMSAFQYAAWAYDTHMLKLMLNYCNLYPQRQQAFYQLLELDIAGHGHGANFDFDLFLREIATACEPLPTRATENNFVHYSMYVKDKFNLLRKQQKGLPVHIINEYLNKASFAINSYDLNNTPQELYSNIDRWFSELNSKCCVILRNSYGIANTILWTNGGFYECKSIYETIKYREHDLKQVFKELHTARCKELQEIKINLLITTQAARLNNYNNPSLLFTIILHEYKQVLLAVHYDNFKKNAISNDEEPSLLHLHTKFITNLTTFSDIHVKEISSFAKTCKFVSSLFKHDLDVNKLLHYIIKLEFNKVKRLMGDKIDLLFEKTRLYDNENRKFVSLSIFQYAIWSCNLKAIEFILRRLKTPAYKELASDQLLDLKINGTKYGNKIDKSAHFERLLELIRSNRIDDFQANASLQYFDYISNIFEKVELLIDSLPDKTITNHKNLRKSF